MSISDEGETNVIQDLGEIKTLNTLVPDKIAIVKKDISTNTSSRALRDGPYWSDINILSFIEDDGSIKPLSFTTSKGEQVALISTMIGKIDDNHIYVYFSGIVSYKETVVDDEDVEQVEYEIINNYTIGRTALINLRDGSVYDLTGFDLSKSLLEGNFLFTIKNGVAYRIDLRNITSAVPLNNGVTSPVSDLTFIVGDRVITNFKVNSSDQYFLSNDSPKYVLDKNGERPPFSIKKALAEPTMSWGYINGNIEYGNLKYQMFDKNGDLYAYRISGDCFTCKVELDEYGNTITSEFKSLSDSSGYSSAYIFGDYLDQNPFNIKSTDTKRVYMKRDGTAQIVTQAEDKGLAIIQVDCPTAPNEYVLGYDAMNNDTFIHFFKENEYVWLNGNTIHYVTIDMDTYTFEDISLFSSIYLVPEQGIWCDADRIYFKMYSDATTVKTYYITKANPIPSLSSTITESVIEILEMNF